MNESIPRPPHDFHIPVMGTGFTIDTPLKVGRFGISSVVSLVDDALIEQMRRHHCEKSKEPYESIPARAEDARARRITAYLDLLHRLLDRQMQALRAEDFEPGTDLLRYYTLLPENPRKAVFRRMMACPEGPEKRALIHRLRNLAVPGSIDVNIMTKVDRDRGQDGATRAPEFSDALSALRGFVRSVVSSSIVFSAGMNARLYSYAASFPEFWADALGHFAKKIILKVSDFRSAAIQAKFLARRGLWVSEFRIESGLNCGGHAFATAGHLMGPILEEFREGRAALAQELLGFLNRARGERTLPALAQPPAQRVTVQGGIGTAFEQSMLMQVYQVDGTGWGSPFLLVPEATCVDPEHLQQLAQAGPEDVYLSDHSPLGVPFWSLKDSASDRARRARIEDGKPGSPCPKGYLATNMDHSEQPLCTASRAYQTAELNRLETADLPEEERRRRMEQALSKACICHDLGGGATRLAGIDRNACPAVCCGPNIVYFSKIATLHEMVDHIYGRRALPADRARPNLFINELRLYVDHLRKESQRLKREGTIKAREALLEIRQNLLSGVSYYEKLADSVADEKTRFLQDLRSLAQEIQAIPLPLLEAAAV